MNAAARIIAAFQAVILVDLHIGHHDEIQIAVAIQVGKSGRGRPPVRHQTGGVRHVLERPVASISVKNGLVQTGHQQVVMPIVVVIADRTAHSIASPSDASRAVTSRKVAIALIAVQPIRTGSALSRKGIAHPFTK